RSPLRWARWPFARRSRLDGQIGMHPRFVQSGPPLLLGRTPCKIETPSGCRPYKRTVLKHLQQGLWRLKRAWLTLGKALFRPTIPKRSTMKRNRTSVAASRVPNARHFATLRTALASGLLGKGAQGRRIMPHVSDQTGVSWEEMSRIGNLGNRDRGVSRKHSR